MSVPTPPDRITPRVVRPAELDWVKFDSQLARDGSVDPVAKALYAALASFVDSDDRDSDPDGDDVPTRAVLAACIGRSVDVVDRATKRLEEGGLLRVHRRRDPNNPKSHLPSVYELLDHERWDERAAARAEARRAARAAAPGRTDAATPGRKNAATPGRKNAATPGRKNAAVLLPPENVSLSEAREARQPGENPAPDAPAATADPQERETAARDETARLIADAWTAGTGLPPVRRSADKIARQAAELLADGHDAAHLALVARWMGEKGYQDLGYALTANDAPRATTAPRRGTTPTPPPVADVIPLPHRQDHDTRTEDEHQDQAAEDAEENRSDDEAGDLAAEAAQARAEARARLAAIKQARR